MLRELNCFLRVTLLALAVPSTLASAAFLTAKLEEIQQLIERGELAAAKVQVNEFLQHSPGNAEALNFLGGVQAQEGEYRAAENSFRRAISAQFLFVGAYLNLGRLYQENRQRDPEAIAKGISVYRQALRVDPSSPEAIYQCALLQTLAGSYASSLGTFPECQRKRGSIHSPLHWNWQIARE